MWVDGKRGRQEKLFETELLKRKFDPDFSAPKVLLDVKPGKPYLDALLAAPPLPRPPESSAGHTHIRATVSVAEVSRAPAVLRWAASFLGAKKDDLSKALAEAMDSI